MASGNASHATIEFYAGDEYAGIDIFRFDENGKVVEHWDVLQVITGEPKNDNGLFQRRCPLLADRNLSDIPFSKRVHNSYSAESRHSRDTLVSDRLLPIADMSPSTIWTDSKLRTTPN